MPFLDRLTTKLADRLPSMITPGAHAVLEYASAAGFMLFGLSAWNRDKRVAVSSVGCGLFTLLSSALTDYASDSDGKLPIDAHARIDIGLAAMVGTIPSFMGLEDKYDARFFRVQAVLIAALAGLTDFAGTGERKQLKRIEKTGTATPRRAEAA